MSEQRSTGLVRAWTFRMFLLVGAVVGFLGMITSIQDRMAVTTHGVAATIEIFNLKQNAPSSWSTYEGHSRAMVYVRVKPEKEREFSRELFLRKDIVDALFREEPQHIIYEDGNPARFVMRSDPLPPYGFGWLVFGFVFLGIFLWSLKLR